MTGLLGMELASNFSDKASSVTCVGRSSIPFANVLGEKIGSMLKKVFATLKSQITVQHRLSLELGKFNEQVTGTFNPRISVE